MKKLLYSAIGAMCLMCSCSNTDDAIPPQKPGGDDPFNPPLVDVTDKEADSYIEWSIQVPNVGKIAEDVTTTLSEMNDYLASVSSDKIDQQIVESYEAQLAKTMNPLSKAGAEFRRAIIKAYNEEGVSSNVTMETVNDLQSFDDSQLMQLGLIITTCIEDETITWNDGLMVPYEQVLDCLMVATGISDIVDLVTTGVTGHSVIKGLYIDGLKKMINAKTLGALVKGIGRHYLGIFGIAWMVYEFGTCMNS